jgi:hypothetical protein
MHRGHGCLRTRAESKGKAGWRRKRLDAVHIRVVRESQEANGVTSVTPRDLSEDTTIEVDDEET